MKIEIEKLQSRPFLTVTDLQRYLHIGRPKAQKIFDECRKSAQLCGLESLGKEVSTARVLKYLGL